MRTDKTSRPGETMYEASGVGLAAPQIGLSIRLFIVDASSFAEDDEEQHGHLAGFKKVFINPIIHTAVWKGS